MADTLTVELLSLGENQSLVLDGLRNGYTVAWAGKGLLGRLRNLGLITVTEGVAQLTPLGGDIAILQAQHRLDVRSRVNGRGALRGAGATYGTVASCSCRDWTWKSNESGARARRRAAEVHVQHTLDAHAA